MNSQLKGLLSMAFASLFFALMGMFVKLCDGIPTIQIVFFRALVAMVFCVIQLRILNISPWGNRKRLLWQRGLFGTMALILYFFTLGEIPFATAATIQQLSPIFTTFLSVFFLGERFFRFQILFLLIAFAGIIFIKGFQAEGESVAYLTGLGASFFAACAYTTIRKIKNDDHPMVIIFYFPLVTIPIALPFTLYSWQTPSTPQWGYLIGVGVCVQVAQYFMTRSYQLAEAGLVSITSYLGVIWAVLLGTFYFEEYISLSTRIGIALVLTGIVLNSWYKIRKQRSLSTVGPKS